MGGLCFYKEPNQYTNEIQKKAVFDIMLSIGWHFNEEKQIWYKEGIKTPEGVFINLKTYLYKNKAQFRVKVTEEMVADMKQMVIDGFTYLEIRHKYNISYDTIVKWIGKKTKQNT
jgi:serine protease inhibitor